MWVRLCEEQNTKTVCFKCNGQNNCFKLYKITSVVSHSLNSQNWSKNSAKEEHQQHKTQRLACNICRLYNSECLHQNTLLQMLLMCNQILDSPQKTTDSSIGPWHINERRLSRRTQTKLTINSAEKKKGKSCWMKFYCWWVHWRRQDKVSNSQLKQKKDWNRDN